MTQIKSGRKAADVKLFIAMPALDGRMHCVTSGSIHDSCMAMIAAGIPNTPHIEYAMQESNLPFGRNRILAQFMATDCSDLLMFDNDMSWDMESFMRLICHPVDFVGGAYRKKVQNQKTGELDVKWAIDFLDPDENGNLKGSDPETGLLEVKRLPAGFLRVTRRAVQRMINECGVPEYQIENHDGKLLTIHRLFSNEWDGKQEIGEDYTFCDRWRSIGGKVWCDPELKVGHHGLAAFHGHLGGWLRMLIEKDRAATQEAA
jgi:hypothetical protein